jgi:glucokinase
VAPHPTVIIAGDIGGTSTRLALFELSGDGTRPLIEKVYRSREHAGLEEIVQAFIAENHVRVAAACFGIAGPVRAGEVQTPNLPWTVRAANIAQRLELDSVHLINDLEANAWGVGALEAHDFAVLNEGNPATGNAAVIAAGTGLGEAGLYWDGRQHLPFACEGGHADFAPRNALEFDLLTYLAARHDRVSYERVVSGPGLHNLYTFLRDTKRGAESPELANAIMHSDPAAAISQAALNGSSELASRALDLFVSLYGAEAGNLALKMMSVAGMYIGGGIAPKILPRLKSPTFMEAFGSKGRMRRVLEAMPVRIVLNDKAALLGAARFASHAYAGANPIASVASGAGVRRYAEVRVLANAAAMARAGAEMFVAHARQAVEDRGRFNAALSGGSTPRALFKLLATDPALRDAMPWNQVHLFWGDERHVPPDAAESNYRMTREALLDHVPIPHENVHPMVRVLAEADVVASDYERELVRFFSLREGALPVFDLVLLGMGADAHTASLFPDSPALSERERLVVANWIEKFQAFRVTLSAAVLNAGRVVLFLVSGADKAQALSQVLHGPRDPLRFPAQLIDPREGRLLWLVDQAAAGMLSTRA